MILKRLVIFLLIGVLVSSCFKYKKPEKPDNLIPKDKMVNILIDAKLISSAEFKDLKALKEKGIDPEHYVFDKYNIDSLQFALSNNYYSYFTDEYEAIYTKVIDSLERLRAYYSAIELKEQNGRLNEFGR